MAHGSPRTCICNKCKMYGLIPRFSSDICPNCDKKVEQITDTELRKKLSISILDSIPKSFTWRKIQ